MEQPASYLSHENSDAAAVDNDVTLTAQGITVRIAGERSFGLWASRSHGRGDVTIDVDRSTITAEGNGELGAAAGIYGHHSGDNDGAITIDATNGSVTTGSVIDNGDGTTTPRGYLAFGIYARHQSGTTPDAVGDIRITHPELQDRDDRHGDGDSPRSARHLRLRHLCPAREFRQHRHRHADGLLHHDGRAGLSWHRRLSLRHCGHASDDRHGRRPGHGERRRRPGRPRGRGQCGCSGPHGRPGRGGLSPAYGDGEQRHLEPGRGNLPRKRREGDHRAKGEHPFGFGDRDPGDGDRTGRQFQPQRRDPGHSAEAAGGPEPGRPAGGAGARGRLDPE